MEFKGIGEAKAVTIAAALELGRRRQQTNALERKVVTCSQDIYEIIGPEIADLSHEEFWIVMLNRRNAVLSHQLVSKGGMTGTVVDPKVLFGIALREKATALAIAHNHPSGQLKPSQGDIQITKQIKEAGKVLNIDIIDHIIVTDQGYYSFADTNNM
jgi:DNA repair protein RadC